MRTDFYSTPARFTEIKKGYGYHLYISDDSKDYFLEAWGASTKHPDFSACLSSDNGFIISEYVQLEYQVFQWLLHRASMLEFPFHARKLTKFALEYYEELGLKSDF